jgi:formiminotetrahydrofolate cyclodeaminase
MKFAEMSVAQLLEALSSSEPTPGGGTAAAIAGAMGASLLVMVTGLAKSRNNTDEEKAALGKARAVLRPLTADLARLADADSESFNAVMAAYRLPKVSDEDKAARSRAIQHALRGATIVPLDTLRACTDALAQAQAVAQHGNRAAASDAGVAIALLGAAAAGAHANVRSNLESIKDEGFTSSTDAEAARLSAAAVADASTAMQALA